MARRTLSQPRSYGNFVRLGLVVALLVGLTVYAGAVLQRYFEVGEVRLPSVVGLPKAEAVTLLQTFGLEPVTFAETVADAALDTVTSQTPQPGSLVREGRSVSLGVNEASAGGRVPGLTASSQEEAEQLLNAAGLELGEVTFRFDSAPEGRVVAQSLAEGESVAANAAVDLVVSRGPEVPRVTLPQLRGLNIDTAKNRLRSLGFSNVVTTATGVSFDRPFTVTDQLPSAGQETHLNAQVVLQYTLSTATVARVPELSGVSLARAQLLLSAGGLSLGAVSYVDDPARPGGVVSFEPAGYTLTGSPVSLTLNSAGTPLADGPIPFEQESVLPNSAATPGLNEVGRVGRPGSSGLQTDDGSVLSPVPGESATGARVIPFDFDPTQQGVASNAQDYKLTLKVLDDQGERVVYENTVGPDERVRIDVPVYGSALLQTFINDNIYQAWSP